MEWAPCSRVIDPNRVFLAVLNKRWRHITGAAGPLLNSVGARSVDLDQRRDGPRVAITRDVSSSCYEKCMKLEGAHALPRELFG